MQPNEPFGGAKSYEERFKFAFLPLSEVIKNVSFPVCGLPLDWLDLEAKNSSHAFNDRLVIESINLSFATSSSQTPQKFLTLSSIDPHAPIVYLHQLKDLPQSIRSQTFALYGPSFVQEALSGETSLATYSFAVDGTPFSGELIFWGEQDKFCIFRFNSIPVKLYGDSYGLTRADLLQGLNNFIFLNARPELLAIYTEKLPRRPY